MRRPGGKGRFKADRPLELLLIVFFMMPLMVPVIMFLMMVFDIIMELLIR